MFAQMLCKSAHILPKIYNHPFNIQLYNDRLSPQLFRHYVEQDELYLRDFSKALFLVSNRFTNEKHSQQFKFLSEYIQQAERKFHVKYLGEERPNTFFNMARPIREKIPVIEDYTAYHLDMVTNASIEEAVAGLTPCFWIFREMGKQMVVSSCPPHHRYRNWIASYSGERFTHATQSIVQTLEELTKEISCPIHQEKICASFVKSLEFEEMFFNEIYYNSTKPMIHSTDNLLLVT